MFPRLSRFYRVLSLCLFLTLVIAFMNTRNSALTNTRRSFFPGVVLQKIQGFAINTEKTETNAEDNVSKNANLIVRHTLDKSSPTPTTVKMVTMPPTNNPHDFQFVINPKFQCNNRNITYFVYVHSAPQNAHKRQMIRQTWGSKNTLTMYNMRLVFVMGVVTDAKVMQTVEMESNHYGDIVVENFLDSYRNLTYKAIAALKWISLYCPNSKYVIKSDDDIFIDIPTVMDYLNQTQSNENMTKNVIMCNQWLRMKVIRDKKSKWYISKEEFPSEFFPPYCSGSVFIMTSDVVPAMFNASFYTEFFWVDDFYITGLLVKRINATQVRLNEGYMLNAKMAFQKFKDDTLRVLKFFHVHKMSQIYRMWKLLDERKNVTLCKNCSSQTVSTARQVVKVIKT